MNIVVPDEYKHLYAQDDEHPVVKVPAEVLRKVAKPIEKITKRHLALAENMTRIMRKARGVGLAAPQVGVLERLIVLIPDGRPMVLFNPEIVTAEGEQVGEEGCLSIPGLYGDVKRAEMVEVKGLDRRGREAVYEMEGSAARIVQHEIDHLDGVLFIDKVDVATLHWMDPYQDERDE
ncbi:MAG: peptide deformylase [Fimbriimonadaceae bacterium]|nr:peptide deformylase [Fimbriimonadaceae bacterium]QYK56050.1 MAG: peptide deformylase [Fimbriimonadaceae bacterium]